MPWSPMTAIYFAATLNNRECTSNTGALVHRNILRKRKTLWFLCWSTFYVSMSICQEKSSLWIKKITVLPDSSNSSRISFSMTSRLPSCPVKMLRIERNGGKELWRSTQRPTCSLTVESDDNQIVAIVVESHFQQVMCVNLVWIQTL